MLNFLLLNLHPLKGAYLSKFVEDAVKLHCLFPCYIACFHSYIQSVTGSSKIWIEGASLLASHTSCTSVYRACYIACFHYFIHLLDPSYSGSPAPVPLHPAPVPSPREHLPALHHSEACSGQWILPCCQEFVWPPAQLPLFLFCEIIYI